MKYRIAAIVIFTLSFIFTTGAQITSSNLVRYSASESECDKSITSEKWDHAERLCSKALADSVRLPVRYKKEKMNVLDNYAFTLFSQSKFQQALSNWTRALNIGKTFLTSSSSDLGRAYFNVGRANQGMASIKAKYIVPAETNYLKAEKIYRAAYKSAADVESKAKAKESIERTLILLRLIAAMRKS